jgi:methylated-DNA-[protein]-cysteine S-methyltransferase
MEVGYYTCNEIKIFVTIENEEVTSISLANEPQKISAQSSPMMKSVIQQIDEYFHGKRRAFHFPIRPKGTDFQQEIWQLVAGIPYGTSLAYVKVAQKFGDAKMVRAVAHAIAKNPILIAIPCHRVIGSDGSLIGYSGGIAVKRQLLELEGFPKQFSVI